MKGQLTWPQFIKWVAYDRRWGLGDQLVEEVIARLAAMFAQSKGTSGAEPHEFMRRPAPELETDLAEAQEAFSAAFYK